MSNPSILIRHEGDAPRERSACGWRDRLISHEDAPLHPIAWAHARILTARNATTTKWRRNRITLSGEGTVHLDGKITPCERVRQAHPARSSMALPGGCGAGHRHRILPMAIT